MKIPDEVPNDNKTFIFDKNTQTQRLKHLKMLPSDLLYRRSLPDNDGQAEEFLRTRVAALRLQHEKWVYWRT